MYRYRHNDVPKWYFACTEVVLQKTHVPKLISYVPKLSCTETVHPFVPKLSCTESDVTPDGVAPSLSLVCVSACLCYLPLHHKAQKFSSGTGSPGWYRKKGSETVVLVVVNEGMGSKLCFHTITDHTKLKLRSNNRKLTYNMIVFVGCN